MKFACAVVSLPITSVQVGVELTQPFVQLTKFRPGAGIAVSVMVVPCRNFAEQVLPQLIALSTPAGVAVTVPLPLRPMERVKIVVKFAVTFIESLTAIVHVDCVPAQAPPQPVNTAFDAGVSVSVTTSPKLVVVLQVPPQLILPFAPVTTPFPFFVTTTDGTPTFAAAF